MKEGLAEVMFEVEREGHVKQLRFAEAGKVPLRHQSDNSMSPDLVEFFCIPIKSSSRGGNLVNWATRE